MRLVFAGTPAVAADTLLQLLDQSGHEVVAVITRPDAPQGRSKRLVPSAVAQLATERGLEVLKPPRPSEPGFLARLAELAPDACPVIAYGALVPQPALDVPRLGWLNVHYSLLPRWRGAAPVQRALLAGDRVTGVSVFQLVPELDAGPVFATESVPIEPAETAGELLGRLTLVGARLLTRVLDDLEAGRAQAARQPTDGITVAPKFTVDQARLDWGGTAIELERLVRACNPSPMAWTADGDERFRVLRAVAVEDGLGLAPGEVAPGRHEVLVGTGRGGLALLEVQPQGKRPMPATAWANGLQGREVTFS